MRKLFTLIVLICSILTIDLNAQPVNQTWAGGGEFQFQQYPNDPMRVICTLTLYRDCAASGFAQPSVKVYFNSEECCVVKNTFFVNLPFRANASVREFTPLCPFNPVITTCTSPATAAPGVRTVVFVDTVTLPKNCTWSVRWTARDTNPLNPPAPLPNHVRMQYRNVTQQTLGNGNATMTIMGFYRNNIPLLSGGFTGNTSPKFVSNPVIYQCEKQDREYDLGYYDVDGDSLHYELTEPLTYDYRTAILWAGGASFNAPFGPNSDSDYFYLDTNLGKVRMRVDVAKLGYYKYAVKVKEYRKIGNNWEWIGETTRDIYVTVINTPNCGDPQNVTNTSYFTDPAIINVNNGVAYPIKHFNTLPIPNVNGQPKPLDTTVYSVRTCRNKLLSFQVRAVSETNYPGAAIVLSADTAVEIVGSSFSSTYVNNLFAPDTAWGTFTWPVPALMKPGKYPLVVQIRDCIDGFIVARILKIDIIVDNPTRLTKKTGNYCAIGKEICTEAFGGRMFTWVHLSGDPTPPALSDRDILGDNAVACFAPAGNACWRVVSDNFCDKDDTICINFVADINVNLTSVGNPNKCYLDNVQLGVDTIPAQAPFTFNWTTNSILSKTDIANPVATVSRGFNVYRVTVTGGSGCQVELTQVLNRKGVNPSISLATDKLYVCPWDTINITSVVSDAICGTDIPNAVQATTLQSKIEGTGVAFSPKPQIFAGANWSGRTQILYKAKELLAAGFKPGKIKSIAWEIAFTASTPQSYKNIEISFACTNKDSLKTNQFETGLTTIYKSASKFIAVPGYDDYPISPEIAWDGKSNLIFEYKFFCTDPYAFNRGSHATRDHVVANYTAVIGTYWDNPSAESPTPTDFSKTLRPNMRFTYNEFVPTPITFDWNPKVGLNSYTSANPKFAFNQNVNYTVNVTTDSGCTSSANVNLQIDTNFKVTNSPNFVEKCNLDTVHILATPKVIPQLPPYTYNCVLASDPNKNCNGAKTTLIEKKVGTGLVNMGATTGGPAMPTPFNAWIASDDKHQFLIRASEMTAAGLQKGLISKIAFRVITKTSIIPFANFEIKMKCTPLTTLPAGAFQPITDIVFSAAYFNTSSGMNVINLTTPYEWDGVSNLLIQTCYDGASLAVIGGNDVVEGSNTPFTSTIMRGQNGTLTGCTFPAATNTFTQRPNFTFTMCDPLPPKPPLVYKYEWIPNTNISNVLTNNIIVWPTSDIKYVVKATYENGCKVFDTTFVKVGKPAIRFDPKDPIVCKGDILDLDITNLSTTTYEYKWRDNPAYSFSAKRTVSPLVPTYYYVKTRATPGKDTLCYREDSILVNIQNKQTMPDLGDTGFVCFGGCYNLRVDSVLGYKNPKWIFNGVQVGIGYNFQACDPGVYSVKVDSGACTNQSGPKIVEERPLENASLTPLKMNICKGDTATILYKGSSGVLNPVWRNATASPLGERAFVVSGATNPIKVYLENPVNQYGCTMTGDTALITVIDTPSVDLGPSKDICLGIGEKIELKASSVQAGVNYVWNDGVVGPGREVSKNGVYTLFANNQGCIKSASITVKENEIGVVDLGPNQMMCCGEVLDYLPPPFNGTNYVRYVWSTGDTTSNLLLKDNRGSGKYTVRAYKANRCYDEGSIRIEDKCSELKMKYQKDTIYLGQSTVGIADHLLGIPGKTTYRWYANDSVNNKASIPNARITPVVPTDTGAIPYNIELTLVDSNYAPPKNVCIEKVTKDLIVLPALLEVPNIFTPNGDSKNDFFRLIKKGEVDVKELRIYNRWGELVHNDVNTPWDGNYKGQPQPSGTYIVYVFYTKAEVKAPIKDYNFMEFPITLIR